MKSQILLLEDDLSLSDTITDYLEDQGYEVTAVYDGDEADNIMYEKNFDLFLLDVNVPYLSGFELLKAHRDNDNKTPAIFITSLNSIDSLETGYNSGCDDYIRKPFALKELLFRIETLLKRGYFHENDSKITIDTNIKYDTDNNILFINDKKIDLSNKESKLLKLFLQHKNETVSHEQIYSTLWEYDESISESSLRTYIKNLRKLIGKDKIVSIKKLGYRFTTE